VLSKSQKPGCGTPGDQVVFTIGDYYAYESWTWTEGFPQQVNLSGPVTVPDVLIGSQDGLSCQWNELTLSFSNKTPIKTVVDSLYTTDQPPQQSTDLDSVWYWNGKAWDGYFMDPASGPSTLKTVEQNKSYWFCIYRDAILMQPKLAPTATTSNLLPDLVIQGANVSPSTLSSVGAANSQVVYTATIKNQGQASASGLDAVLYLSNLPTGSAVVSSSLGGTTCVLSGTPPGQVAVRCDTASLAANATMPLSVTVRFGASVPAGTYVARVLVDEGGRIQERLDNYKSSDIQLVVS
jgi:hypothetical protein